MIKYLEGNCIDKIKELEDNSIDCVVSSPPYFGLRDYGTAQWQGGDLNCKHTINDGTYDPKKGTMVERPDRNSDKSKCIKCGAKRIDEQFGLEKTYQDYIANTVKVFETFKPKLKDTATIWWNVGDSYASFRPMGTSDNGQYKSGLTGNRYATHLKLNDIGRSGKTSKVPGNHYRGRGKISGCLKPKDLLMIPNRVAIALQEAGWYIRSEIIWHKPNPMPESVRDSPTSAHEKIWLITKNKKYYYDADAIKEPSITKNKPTKNLIQIKGADTPNIKKGGIRLTEKGTSPHFPAPNFLKNKRNVWTVTTKPFRGAHFATFPKDLIEPCIKAGCPEKVCFECKTPYKKNYKRQRIRRDELDPTDHRYRPNKYKGAYEEINGKGDAGYQSSEFIGFEKDCKCKTDKFESGVVLDPFAGAGTTGLVAKENNRNAILIELNGEYLAMAKKRIETILV